MCVQQSQAVGAAEGTEVVGIEEGERLGAAVGAGSGAEVGWPGNGVGAYLRG